MDKKQFKIKNNFNKSIMRQVYSILAIVLFGMSVQSCKSILGDPTGRNGELTGVQSNGKWRSETPLGMVLVPRGTYTIGKTEEDIADLQNAPARTVSVRSFYMDETEITNSEYRQFVNWVKDSVVRSKLAIIVDELGLAEDGDDRGIGRYAFMDADTTDMSEYEKYMYNNYYGFGDDLYEGRRLNWRVDIEWDTRDYIDQYYAEVMDSMYLPPSENFNGERAIDVEKLQYKYVSLDVAEAARNRGQRRSDFVKSEVLKIYPDTTVWIRDFDYSYNEPMHNDYFWHDAYGDYPVVGINWEQAKAFCNWRTKFKNDFLKRNREQRINQFRLPTEAEWEYAARGGLEGASYPWGGPYLIDEGGEFKANFKPQRGDYAVDGALYTVEAKSYDPNDFGLYNMAGNVAEWTNSSYDPNSYEMMSSMNPDALDKDNIKKVVRGGSWKDVAYFLQVSTRDYEYRDSARSYIGFRTVQDYMGNESFIEKKIKYIN
jgi:gliding motility-associated lipoprotein GldK